MFAKIRQFITDKPGLLSTQLSKLEGNIDKALDDLESATLPSFSQPTRALGSQKATLTTGQLLICDATAGNILVSLDRPRAELKGQLAALVHFGGGTVTAVVTAPIQGGVQGKIQAGASATLPTGLRLLLCDGQDWWFN